MHIVYVIAPGGGPEAYVKTLAPGLIAQGHSVSVIYTTPTIPERNGVDSSIRVAFAPPTAVHYYLAKIVGNWHALPRRVRAWETAKAVECVLGVIDRARKIDLVEVTEGLPIASLRKKWRVVVRAHSSDWTFRHFCQDGDRRGDQWLIEMEREQLGQASGVSAISQHLADHISEFCDFPRDKVAVIPYPIHIELFCSDNHSAQGNSFSLLAVGRLEKRKGTAMLIRALSAKVWQNFPALALYLIGSESDLTRSDLLALVPADKVSQVIFPGFVEHRKLPDYYHRATIYVAPTLYETFAYTILEAMACGVPVIASKVGAIPELVEDGITGLLVPPNDPNELADAIICLMSDHARCQQMGIRAREKAVKNYSLDQVLPRMVEFYGDVLGGQMDHKIIQPCALQA